MRILFVITCALFILNVGFVRKNIRNSSQSRWVIERNSSLNIQGETNINNFQCDVTEYLKPDTLAYTENNDIKKLSFTNSCLLVDVKRFDCHNRFITDDFRAALKADENPNLKIVFLTIDQFSANCNSQSVKGIVEIGLARLIRRVEIDYTIKTLPGNRIQMNGSHIFSFSDFNLKAPRKLAGLIRTKDLIKVNFQLFFRAI